MPGTDRRYSTSSEDASAPPLVKQLAQDGTEIIPTRMSKVTTPKPASNPLQFIKTGPCDLYKAAQEQIKKVEEIKKVERVKDDSEDWQSNLDNWKCSRRKRQEHIIERVVEVKKLELEEHDRNRRRSKTFNEMMEERSSKGGLRKMSILSYSEDDSNDLSDLGISTNKEKSSGGIANESQIQNRSNRDCQEKADNGTELNTNGHNAHKYDEESITPATVSSPEPEEYTYERAIQGYMNFAEAKIKTPIKGAGEQKDLNGKINVKVNPKPGGKIGEKLSELEQIRLRSKSTNDINGGNEARQLPKVDISKRRSLFENSESIEAGKCSEKPPKEISKSKSMKERLSNLEKNNDTNTKANRLSGEISPNIKETISSLEKQKESEGKRMSNGDISSQVSIKERLTSLEKQMEMESLPKNRGAPEEIRPVSIKERMSSLDSTTSKELPKLTPERDASFKEKLETFKSTEKSQNDVVHSISESNPNVCSDSVQSIARPLDRLEAAVEKPESEKPEEDARAGQPLPDSDSAFKSECTDGSAPVSLLKEGGDNLVVDSLAGSGDGSESVRKETDTEELTQAKGMTAEAEKGEVGNSSVKGCEEKVEKNISETIVTQIRFPDAAQCSRVNISVSVDSSGAEETTLSEDEEAQDAFPEELPTGLRDCMALSSPKTRVRKLTPLTTPKISITPLKTVCELQIIEEGETPDYSEDGENKGKEVESEEKVIAVHMNHPKRKLSGSFQSNNELQEPETKTEIEDEQQEELSIYTDENIDEVLGKDDEVETSVDDDSVVTEESKIQKELEIFTAKENPSETKNNQTVASELREKPVPVSATYENVFIYNQVPQLSMSPDSDMYATLSFPLGSRPPIEPPKEKPPPPPLELSDDESTKPELPPKPSLRRLDSTKRIKKEIRKKRSDFLGIEGSNDDNYLEPEIYVAPPPDMMTFLQEERRLEQQLYRQSICSESDSNHETAESRDSGVELDRGHVDDICWSKPDPLSEPHSRQNSEGFGNTSITSEEDIILKKEREIIEVLEKEEQWRYGNKNSQNGEQNDIGEKLAVKLRQLEQEKMQLERERAEEEGRRKAEETARRQNEQMLMAKQQQLREQENTACTPNMETSNDQEALRFERERLQKEQEHLERCRQKLIQQHQQQNSKPVDVLHRSNSSHWDTPSNRHSLQEVPIGVQMQDIPRHSMQDVSQPQYESLMSSGYRYSLPDLQQRDPRSSRPPPPIPPAKPMRPMTQEQWERETNIRNSRIPSADNIPLQIEASSKLRHGSSVPAINVNHGGQQMSRSTLHALSAAPRSRIINSENWLQPKRKVDAPKTNYNYQHWLIQEAEHRRILEHQQKVSQQLQPKRLPYNGQSQVYVGSPPSHHTVGLPISSPVQGHPGQKWMPPSKADKPLPDSVIQTLTQRLQNKESKTPPRRRMENPGAPLPNKIPPPEPHLQMNPSGQSQERMLSVSGKKKCSHCNEELGRGAAMIIESLRLFYHIDCFKCCVCHVQLGDGLMGTDVRVRNNKLHCHNCYSSDDGSEGADKHECNRCEIEEVLSHPVNLEVGDVNLTNELDRLESLSLVMEEEMPIWFERFLGVYQFNERRKFAMLQQIQLQLIDFDIKKFELLKGIIEKLKD